MAACFRCGSIIQSDGPVGRAAECASCTAPIRVCRNCTFYEPGAHWDCRESIPDPVHDKERANFCDYFRINERSPGSAPTSGIDKAGKARTDFDALFS